MKRGKHRTEVTEVIEGELFGSRTCSQILELLQLLNSCCYR
jgi:hypothetical protein